jgi:hypothetical protein
MYVTVRVNVLLLTHASVSLVIQEQLVMVSTAMVYQTTTVLYAAEMVYVMILIIVFVTTDSLVTIVDSLHALV